jgi:hypothetical protein
MSCAMDAFAGVPCVMAVTIVCAMLQRNGFTDVKDAQGRTPADVAAAAGKVW